MDVLSPAARGQTSLELVVHEALIEIGCDAGEQIRVNFGDEVGWLNVLGFENGIIVHRLNRQTFFGRTQERTVGHSIGNRAAACWNRLDTGAVPYAHVARVAHQRVERMNKDVMDAGRPRFYNSSCRAQLVGC